MIHMTTDNFEEIKLNNDKILIDFWAEWCQPCKFFGPIFEASEKKHDDITYIKVDVDSNPELSQAFGISSIPSIVAIENGEIVKFDAGARDMAGLDLFIEQSFSK